jgi:nitrogen fixation protein FixH
LKPLIVVAALAALGAVAATIWVGGRVREDTVVSRPYEEGLAYDAERHAREAAGFVPEVVAVPSAGAPGPLAFTVRDGAGRLVEGAVVTLLVGRPDTSRGQLRAVARADGPGRYVADVGFPEAGAWDVRFELQRGTERARITRGIEVPRAPPASAGSPATSPSPPASAGAPATSPPASTGSPATSPSPPASTGSPATSPSPPASAGGEGRGEGGLPRLGPAATTVPLPGGGEITLDLSPRPLRTMRELEVTADLRGPGLDGAVVKVAFVMPGMEMGPNEAALAAAGAGRHSGTAVLIRCASGRKDWIARITVTPREGAARTATLAFQVAE